jgi:hypothetical protein
MMNGDGISVQHSRSVCIGVNGKVITLVCFVLDILPGFDMLLGMDAINLLGGVSIQGNGQIEFPTSFGCVSEVSPSLDVNDQDFHATFRSGKWCVEWKWIDGATMEPKFFNSLSQYTIPRESRHEFEKEVQEWIDCGWLQPYSGEEKCLIPLMAVVQENKNKVRPVLDYRELNQYVSSHTAESVVCGETLRRWRKLGTRLKLLDLRKAYLQINVDYDLWKYQVVRFKGQTYCLTRLGFGLNVAPKIMTAIVNRVLSTDQTVRAGTDSYIDDIIVNEDIVSCERVVETLKRFGLEAKPPATLVGGRVLGLRIKQEGDVVKWCRDNRISPLKDTATKRDLFSLCGQLIGHFPVCGWLRPACSYVKRCLNQQKWEDVSNIRAMGMMNEILRKVSEHDPAQGRWDVSNDGIGRIWCDASSLALGVAVEIGGSIVEDASWLRKKDDPSHINLAELEAALKGINMAILWGLKAIEILTDSATVFGWLISVVNKSHRVRTNGLGEALVRRRLALLKDIILEYDLSISVTKVSTHQNKADCLTRVPKKWLTTCPIAANAITESRDPNMHDDIKKLHDQHHFGIRRTLYISRKCLPDKLVTEEDVRRVVKSCRRCLSIDPQAIVWKPGHLDKISV